MGSDDLQPSMVLALQHTLGNGLKLLRHKKVDAARKGVILEHLVELFVDADKAGRAMVEQNVLFAVREPEAFEHFTIFFRYLKSTFGDHLQERLSEASKVMQALRDEKKPSKVEARRTEELIEKLLDALEREEDLRTAAVPQSFLFAA